MIETENKVTFAPGVPLKVQFAFLEARKGFKYLQDKQLLVQPNGMKKTIMRAQPIIDAWFFSKSKRRYKVEYQPIIQLAHSLQPEDLPIEVLIGWFAHELGHIMDYLERPWYDLLKMGIAYTTLPIYRMGAERRADLFAIEHGFASYIQETKKFILEHSNMPDKYINKINKYYMSPEEVSEIVLKQSTPEGQMDKIF